MNKQDSELLPTAASPAPVSTIEYHQKLMSEFNNTVKKAEPFYSYLINHTSDNAAEDAIILLLHRVEILSDNIHSSNEECALGPWLINTIVSYYPHLTPYIPRDLFWFFGGECMHFLGDEEIIQFQKIDEAYSEAINQKGEAAVDYLQIRSQYAGFH